MNGRHFSGMVVKAYVADGSERFNKTDPKHTDINEGDEESRRLDQFGEWLEGASSGEDT